MDRDSEPNCSNNTKSTQNEEMQADITLSHQSNIQIAAPNALRSFNLDTAATSHESAGTKPLSTLPLIIGPSYQSTLTCQTRSNLPSPSQPPSLFLQALSKINESSHNFAVITKLKLSTLQSDQHRSGEIKPPDSLTSAPPSYSFVLRQMAARRRPRLMGTFIPSPSFVQQTPPPNYAMAFDIYVDNTVPPPPTRVYDFGLTSIPAVCPECGHAGMTMVTTKINLCTHMCAFLLCIFCCWICAPLPYILRSCKDVYHHCRGCRNFLGMYSPTNPENTSYRENIA